MDLAQTLVRSVMRTFYDTKHILVIDALIIHSALRDDDLAFLMGTNPKELHKLCGKLKEDRFLAVHTRSELKEGSQRPMNRTYYYIDYRATIDAIKWRVFQIDKAVQGKTVPEDERKAYGCPRCGSQWTMFEVLDSRHPSGAGFACHKCKGLLALNSEDDRGGHEQSTRLNKQFRFMTDLLPKIDQVVVPDNTFEIAINKAVPVVRGENNPANNTVPIDSIANRPTAVKGLSNTGPTTINVTLTTSEGPTEADKAADQARKDALALQNQLPTHFTHSTITGERIVTGPNPTIKADPFDESADKKSAIITPSGGGDATEIDSYFAQLKAEQAREAIKEEEEEYESDSDEEDLGFEDVVPATGSAAGTPASTTFANGAEKSQSVSGLTSALKRSGTGTGSSNGGTSTAGGSPVTGPQTPESGRAAKKVRIEEPTVADEEESEEDVEFEDV